MKKYRLLIFALIAFSMTACRKNVESSDDNNPQVMPSQTMEVQESSEVMEEPESNQVPTPEPVVEEPAEPLYVDFAEGCPTGYEIADGWTNGSMFNVTWRRKNVTFENGCMQLIIDNDAAPSKNIPYMLWASAQLCIIPQQENSSYFSENLLEI